MIASLFYKCFEHTSISPVRSVRKSVLVVIAVKVERIALEVFYDLLHDLNALCIRLFLADRRTLAGIIDLAIALGRRHRRKLVQLLRQALPERVQAHKAAWVEHDVHLPKVSSLRQVMIHGRDMLAERDTEQHAGKHVDHHHQSVALRARDRHERVDKIRIRYRSLSGHFH